MTILATLLTLLTTYGIGRLLVRYLGWPTGFAALGRWLAALLVAALLCAALPGLLRATRLGRGPWPAVDLGELLVAFCLLGLAALGYVGWTRGELARERARQDDAAARHVQRRRALPPPPAPAEADDGFAPVGAPSADEE